MGVPAVLLLYRKDRDVPPWTGLRTAGCHLALARRVFERRPDIQVVPFDKARYREQTARRYEPPGRPPESRGPTDLCPRRAST
jgi:hypothetical protein